MNQDEWIFLSNLPSTIGRFIVFDTETTGLIPKYDHVLEIAATEIINGKLTGNQFHIYIKPRTKIRKEATEVNRMDNDFYKKHYENVFENEKQLLINFLRYVNNSIIFAHNAIFDCNFINKELEFHNLPTIPKEKFRCTMRILKKFSTQNKINSFSLEKCAEHFEIETIKDRLHSGSYDAEICAMLLIKLFDKYNVNENTSKSNNSNITIENYVRNLNFPKTLTSNTLKDKSTNNGNTDTIPSSGDRSAKDLRTGLQTTMDNSHNNNYSGVDINDDEFHSQRELSVCITDFDNLSLVYTDSRATTNTMNPIINYDLPNSIHAKYDEKIKNHSEMNRSNVINTTNRINDNNNVSSFQKNHDMKRKEFEEKIDRNTLKEQFENLNK